MSDKLEERWSGTWYDSFQAGYIRSVDGNELIETVYTYKEVMDRIVSDHNTVLDLRHNGR